MKNKYKNFALALCALSLSSSGFAATITSTATGGDFNLGTTWLGGVAPGPLDDAVIQTAPGNSVVLTTDQTVNSLVVGGGIPFGVLEISGTNTLTLTTSGLVDGANVGLVFSGTGTLEVGSNLTFDNSSTIDMNAGNISVFGNLTLSGAIFDSGTSTVTMNGNTSQLISGPFTTASGNSFYNLVVNNTNPSPSTVNSVTTGGSIDVTNLLDIQDGAFRSFNVPAATHSIYNDINIGPDGNMFLASAGGTIDVIGDFNNDGFFNSQGQGTHFVGSVNQLVTGAIQFSDIEVDNSGTAPNDLVSFVNDGEVIQVTGTTTLFNGRFSSKPNTVYSGTLTIGAGTEFIRNTASVNIFQSDIINNGTYTAATGSEVQMTGPNDQVIGGTTGFNGADAFSILRIAKSSNTATVTASASTPIDADVLDVDRGIFRPPSGSVYGDVTINGPLVSNFGTLRPESMAVVDVRRNLTRNNNGFFLNETGTIRLNGSGATAQQISGGFGGPNAFHDLVVNHTGASNEVQVLFTEIEIDNFLDLQRGEVRAVSSFPGFIAPPDIFVDVAGVDTASTGVRSSRTSNGPTALGGFVNGPIRRTIGDGILGSRLFAVGTSGQYTPATMNVTTGNSAGGKTFVDVFAVNAEHPETAAQSGDSALAHDRYWDVANLGTSGMTFNLTLGYDDIENTTVEANQRVARHLPSLMAFQTYATAINTTTNNAIGTLDSPTEFGEFTLLEQNPIDPLKVDLLSFEAYNDGPGEGVELVWETVAEFDTVGFHILTGDKNGPVDQITPHMIFSLGNEFSGARYAFFDENPVAEGEVRYYYLQDTEITGTTGIYGPVVIKTQEFSDASIHDWILLD